MKKILTRTLPALLLAAAIMASCLPALAATGTTRFVLNNSDKAITALEISGQSLTVENLPDRADRQVLWLRLVSSNGTRVFEQFVSRSRSGSAAFQINNISPGTYSLEIYGGPQRYDTFWPMISGEDVRLEWTSRGGTFLMPQWASHNLAVMAGKRADLAALAYYLEPTANIQSKDPAIATLAGQIVAGLMGNYEKALAIHDWVSNNIYYDYDDYYGRVSYDDVSAAATLNRKHGVCAGYSNLTAALLRAAGIPAKRISGFSLGLSTSSWPRNFDPKVTTNHAWNEAYVDGRWIILDTTWDSNNAWEHGKITKSEGAYRHTYFDITPAFFAADHVIQDYSEAAIDRFIEERARTATAYTGRIRVNRVFGLDATLYSIEGANYIKLRDAAAMLSGMGYPVELGWIEESSTVTLTRGKAYSFVGGELAGRAAIATAKATLPIVQVELDGEKLFLPAYAINGATYFRLRDIGDLFGFGVGYESETRTILIDLFDLPSAD